MGGGGKGGGGKHIGRVTAAGSVAQKIFFQGLMPLPRDPKGQLKGTESPDFLVSVFCALTPPHPNFGRRLF